jgi:hypothetical protein
MLTPFLMATLSLPLLPGPAPAAAQISDRPFLGVTTEQIEPGDEKSGIKVVYVWPGSAAERLGLKVGDEIVALNDFLIPNTETFVQQLRREKAPVPGDPGSGSTLRFIIRRGGERLKIKGKIGSYRQTMTAYQETVRKRMVGKPLPPLPPLKWWDAKERKWVERADPLSQLQGKLAVITAFDDCPRCTQHRYDKFVKMRQVLAQIQPDAPIAFLGVYQSDYQETREGREQLFDHAQKLFEKIPPSFPVAVAYYPGGPLKPTERQEQLHILQHGQVILDPSGKVQYVQILGIPEREFLLAYQKLAQKYVEKKN